MKFRQTLPCLAALVLVLGACSSGASSGSGGGGGVSGKGGSLAGGGTMFSGGAGGSTGNGGANTGGNKATGGSSSPGGNQTTGGASGSGGAAGAGGTCTNGTPCGGDVLGTWSITSSCLKLSGQASMAALGLGCVSAGVTGSLKVTGTWTAKSNGTYADATETTGNEQLSLPASCLEISGTKTTCEGLSGILAGFYDTINCVDASSGGCTCAATVKQQGWPGWVSIDASDNGMYKTAANVLSLSDEAQYSYCVSSGKMTWTVQSPDKDATVTGTVVFQSGNTTGSGGAGGKGGTSGAGGVTSLGGAAGGAAGGNAGAGGTVSAGGAGGTGGTRSTGTGGSTTSGTGPCDIYAAAATPTPCVGAYSMGRLLYSKYTGPLYQVRKGGTWDKTNGPSGGTFRDIGMVGGGYADVSAQDDFCAGATCTVSILYDQSGKKNDLKAAPAGCYKGGDGAAAEADKESSATRRSTTLGGQKVYALQMLPHEGYRNNKTTDMVTGTAAQGIYMLADGKKAGTACCWDFGNAMPTNCADGTGSMDALMLGTGGFGKGAGNGPWFIGDFEFGVWACGSQSTSQACTNPDLPSMNTAEFAFGILKTSTSGNTGQYCIRTADPGTGNLKTAYDGQAPQPWHLGGAIILGIGGDNSNWSFGTFFEGVITAGRPKDDTDALVYANVQAVKYGQ